MSEWREKLELYAHTKSDDFQQTYKTKTSLEREQIAHKFSSGADTMIPHMLNLIKALEYYKRDNWAFADTMKFEDTGGCWVVAEKTLNELDKAISDDNT